MNRVHHEPNEFPNNPQDKGLNGEFNDEENVVELA